MGVARRRGLISPTPRLPALDEFEGMWVAVKDDVVVAAAATSRGLAFELHQLGNKGRGAVTKFVSRPSDSVMVGLG